MRMCISSAQNGTVEGAGKTLGSSELTEGRGAVSQIKFALGTSNPSRGLSSKRTSGVIDDKVGVSSNSGINMKW